MKYFSLYFQCNIQPELSGLYLQPLLLPKDTPKGTRAFYKSGWGPILTPDVILRLQVAKYLSWLIKKQQQQQTSIKREFTMKKLYLNF